MFVLEVEANEGRYGYRLEAELRWDDRANDGSRRDTTIYALLAEDFLTLE